MPRLLVSLLLVVCSASLTWAQSTNLTHTLKLKYSSAWAVIGERNSSEINFGSFKIKSGFNTETGLKPH